MKLTVRQMRAERRKRNMSMVDMNLVSLIDVFTILIFFLLSNSVGESLPSPKAVLMPESIAEQSPRDTLVVIVSGSEILVDGRKVANVADVLAMDGDIIAPLKNELDLLRSSRKMIRKEDEALSKRLTIMGDKEIPYRLLRKIMETSARSDFTDVSFAVRQRSES
jgi:biopolymer transport protein ExbD